MFAIKPELLARVADSSCYLEILVTWEFGQLESQTTVGISEVLVLFDISNQLIEIHTTTMFLLILNLKD